MSSLSNHSVIETAGGYQIPRSLRLRASATAYLSRTFATPTNATTFTFSTWVKRGKLGTAQSLLGASTNHSIGFNASDQIVLTIAGTGYISTAVFRDPSAWYHIVYTQNGTSYNVYVNGVSVLSGTSVANTAFNTAIAHQLGASNTTNFSDGYLAETYFVDGQALAPINFGQTDSATGQWAAKKYAGTYGNNGFYLPYSNTSTTTTLCADASGNSNNWTTAGISLTAGVTYDSMIDVPSLAGDISGTQPAGNYAVLNPLDKDPLTATADGNLKWASTGGSTGSIRADIGMLSGKWYCEVAALDTVGLVGISKANASLTIYPGGDSNGWSYYAFSGQKYSGGSALTYGAAYGAGDIIGIAFNADTGELSFYKNGVAQGVAFTGLTSGPYFFAVGDGSGTNATSCNFNFGQRPFSYTPPTGYKALCTANLTSDTVTTTGSFTGNATANGPFIWTNGAPETLTINGNIVTFGTHADKLANGFKLRTTSTLYNSTGTNTWTATILSPSSKSAFRNQNAKGNP